MSKQYEITNRIPLPSRFQRPSSKFPLTKMKIGDSFFIPIKDIPNPRKPLHVVPYNMARKLKMKITTRIEPLGVRVWRVK